MALNLALPGLAAGPKTVAELRRTKGVRRKARKEARRWFIGGSMVIAGGLTVAALVCGNVSFGAGGLGAPALRASARRLDGGDVVGDALPAERRRLQDDNDADDGDPEQDGLDPFDMDQKRHGAVILHCLGLLYTFVALATVCDECFVPALEVITEVLGLSNDVAGATFMAAGGSAPEFFTSIIGVLVLQTDIGIGTIVGSAVFNVLFVIGACAFVAPGELRLTWFPLFRDSMFYLVDLCVLTGIFVDSRVEWYEAALLFILYIAYTTFMAFSEKVEKRVLGQKEPIQDKNGECWAKPREVTPALQNGDVRDVALAALSPVATTAPPDGERRKKLSDTSDKKGKAAGKDEVVCRGDMRVLTLTQNRSPRVSGEAPGQLVAAATGAETDSEEPTLPRGLPPTAGSTPSPADNSQAPSTGSVECVYLDSDGSPVHASSFTPTVTPGVSPTDLGEARIIPDEKGGQKTTEEATTPGEDDEDEEEGEPMNVWPPARDAPISDWLWYFFTLPICGALVLTVPDVRREGWKKFFALSFFLSIAWIAVITRAMLWFAVIIAQTCYVPDIVIGVTVLAAGTSVPDLLTSIIVTRKGQGDMAISSSIGSNIFDVTMCLPVPWLIYSISNGGEAISIGNNGLLPSVLILMLMVGFTVGSIMWSKWVMTQMLGFTMMGLYCVFEVIAVLSTTVLEEHLGFT